MNAIVKAEPQKMMLLAYMADKYSLREDEFSKTVRATCGLDKATPEQFAAFLIVAKQYDLNPLTKEIYAFPSQSGGIVPIVSVDGWVNLVNSHPQCDGFQFTKEHDMDGKLISYTCTMHRKDRKYPVQVEEFLSECIRSTQPWKMQHRMLRHKSFIQAARLSFGFAGIYDEDEGRVIAESIDVTRDYGPPRSIPAIDHQATAKEPEQTLGEVLADPVANTPSKANTAPEAPQGPHAIGGGKGAKGWAKLYVDAVLTSGDPATVFQWVDANQKTLEKLGTADAALLADVRGEVDRHLAFLRKTAPKEDPISSGISKPAVMPNIDDDYAGWMAWAVKQITETDAGDPMEALFESFDPWWSDLMPSDRETLLGARKARETAQET